MQGSPAETEIPTGESSSPGAARNQNAVSNQDQDPAARKRSGGKSGESGSGPANSETLLAVFERPPDAPGETINSAVIIAAESRAAYPKIKTAVDYFGPISDLAEESGLKPVNDPYAFAIGNKQLVREDFSGERGKLTMFQSSLVMIDKGQIVSFTFVAGSEDDLEDLIGDLSFGTLARPEQATHR
jgi:hypothetical protein